MIIYKISVVLGFRLFDGINVSSFTISQTLSQLAFINALIFVNNFSLSMRFTVLEIAYDGYWVKLIHKFSTSIKDTFLKIPFIKRSIGELINTLATHLSSAFQFTIVTVSVFVKQLSFNHLFPSFYFFKLCKL